MPKELIRKSLRVDADLVRAYAEVTKDFNPIHVDEEYAKGTSFGTRIAHGTLSLNLLWEAIEATITDLDCVEIRVTFRKPVTIGDVVTAGGYRQDDGDGTYQVFVRNQHGDEVICGVAQITKPLVAADLQTA
ncbi:Acyl dehydratase [Hyphomicrobiales bacterium]|nr:Acyl dehydratase [Hyphomicrobiales bacterium]CAH1692014.1 Acyl dehydratase [Hyphomicrobiales bacterium]